MESTSFMKVDEVAQELGVSKSYAYKIVQKLNAELAEKGYMVISRRVNNNILQNAPVTVPTRKRGKFMAVYKEEKNNLASSLIAIPIGTVKESKTLKNEGF